MQILSDWFLWAILAMVSLASLFPQWAAAIHANTLSDYGIFTIFFLYGVNLSVESLRTGLVNWRLHLLVQLSTFVLFPLLFVPFRAVAGPWLPPDLLLGFFYLCALPSTISSSVAMTAIARGNVPAAIFNATLSSLLGVVVTPALVSLVAQTTGQAPPLGQTVTKVATLLLLPFALGQLLRPFAGRFFGRYKKYTAISDKCIILLLVFAAFSDSVNAGLWTTYGPGVLALTVLATSALLAFVLALTTTLARLLRFTVPDEIVAVLCGSKKTLASGAPMAKLIFAGSASLGPILLPIIVYHQIQLFVCSVLARRYAGRVELS
ncbi:MAG: bile acid:sodium symporter [Acidobacteriaceae bacterium]|nr:bile acid:sodium symporter [Acidobacteriaceae bacterium]